MFKYLGISSSLLPLVGWSKKSIIFRFGCFCKYWYISACRCSWLISVNKLECGHTQPEIFLLLAIHSSRVYIDVVYRADMVFFITKEFTALGAKHPNRIWRSVIESKPLALIASIKALPTDGNLFLCPSDLFALSSRTHRHTIESVLVRTLKFFAESIP